MGEYLIIGTAGHVDHGKTQLVLRLTGQNTDRLKEEKERGISIELGFAPFALRDGRKAAIIDVPGHERFIRQMLAGAGGMDIVLLVIAADEGIMPQTREHLDIIELLKIEKGIVVITKKDLVEPEWLELVMEEVREYLKGTRLEKSPMAAVSAMTGEGIEELKSLIEETLPSVRGKERVAKVRLPVDRAFTVSGFGTVVTGTLFSGTLRIGDALELLPGKKLQVRVRNLQVHGERVEEAYAGQRVAVNLSGVELSEVERGMVLLSPGYLEPAYRLTLRLELLENAPKNLKHGERVRFHLGTSESLGRITLLDRDELEPGEQALAQIAMEEPVVAARGDRFVIRSYSPPLTIGGGTVIEPSARKLKRNRPEVLADLEKREQGDERDLLLQYLKEQKTIVSKKDLLASLHWGEDALISASAHGDIRTVPGDGGPYFLTGYLEEEFRKGLHRLLADVHRNHPLRLGLGREEIRSRLFQGVANKAFNSLLEEWKNQGDIQVHGQWVGNPGHTPHEPEGYEGFLERITDRFRQGGFQPPGWEEVKQTLGKEPPGGWEEFLQHLVEKGTLVKLGEDLFLHQEAVDKGWALLEEHLREKGELAVSEARDMLGSSRKFVLPLLEYFDRQKKTRRSGEKRVLF